MSTPSSTAPTTIVFNKDSEVNSQKRLDTFIGIIDNIERDLLPLKQKHDEIMQLLNWNKDNLMINEKDLNTNPSNEETQFKDEKIAITTHPAVVTTATSSNQMEFQKPFMPPIAAPPFLPTSAGIISPMLDFMVTVKDNKNQKKNMAFDEILKLKRDLKRRSLKYKQSKTPPLTYTEEIRALIQLQFEGWNQFLLASDEAPLELKDL